MEASHAEHSGIYLEIGTISAVADENITISMHSGGSTTLGHEFVQDEVNVHNDIVSFVIKEKKRTSDNDAASHEQAHVFVDASGTDTGCNADANGSENACENDATVIDDLQGPLHNPPPPPPLQELHMPLSISDATIAQATQIMQAAKLNARARKKRAKEELEGDVTNVRALKKKLKLAMDDQKVAKALRVKEKASRKIDTAPEDKYDEFGLPLSAR
jgi:hypothetical protein